MPRIFFYITVIFLLILAGGCSMEQKNSEPTRVLVLTGGHGYDQPEFEEMFNSFDQYDMTFAGLDPDGTFFDDISGWDYDVMVFYHFRQPLSERSQANFLELTKNGVGIVALHHAIAGFPDWDTWRDIVGAKYFLADTTEDGAIWKRCTYQHDVDIPVVIADSHHPVTHRIEAFTIHDETYKGYRLEEDNDILLTTQHPLSQQQIGWTRGFNAANVCYLQLGHDKKAYMNPSYRQLVLQAIAWASQN